MPGLPTGGVVSIPNEFGLRRSEANQGEWLNFKICYSDKTHTGEPFFHLYKMSMWVPQKEVDKCIDMIKPGRFFRITAHVDARVGEHLNGYDPVPQLRVDYKYFIPVKIGKLE